MVHVWVKMDYSDDESGEEDFQFDAYVAPRFVVPGYSGVTNKGGCDDDDDDDGWNSNDEFSLPVKSSAKQEQGACQR